MTNAIPKRCIAECNPLQLSRPPCLLQICITNAHSSRASANSWGSEANGSQLTRLGQIKRPRWLRTAHHVHSACGRKCLFARQPGDDWFAVRAANGGWSAHLSRPPAASRGGRFQGLAGGGGCSLAGRPVCVVYGDSSPAGRESPSHKPPICSPTCRARNIIESYWPGARLNCEPIRRRQIQSDSIALPATSLRWPSSARFASAGFNLGRGQRTRPLKPIRQPGMGRTQAEELGTPTPRLVGRMRSCQSFRWPLCSRTASNIRRPNQTDWWRLLGQLASLRTIWGANFDLEGGSAGQDPIWIRAYDANKFILRSHTHTSSCSCTRGGHARRGANTSQLRSQPASKRELQ